MKNTLLLGALLATLNACATSNATNANLPSVQSARIHRQTMTLKWKLGDLYVLPDAGDGQCGTPLFFVVGGVVSAVGFTLTKGTNGSGACTRNQLNPLAGSTTTLYFTPGNTYEWDFTTITNMRVDPIAYDDRLVWQLHQGAPISTGSGCALSPITALHITTLPNTTGSGTTQYWNFVYNTNGIGVKLTYTEGGTDTWKVQALISNGADGYHGFTKVWRNGNLKLNYSGPNYSTGCHIPWSNFGPYEWMMADTNYQGPTTVNISFDSMNIYQL